MKVYNEEHGISNKRKCEEQEAVPPGPRELLGEFVNVEKANKLKKNKKKTSARECKCSVACLFSLHSD